MQGDVTICATSYREGSVIVDTLIELKNTLEELPFENTEYLLEYRKLVSESVYKEATAFFRDIKAGNY